MQSHFVTAPTCRVRFAGTRQLVRAVSLHTGASLLSRGPDIYREAGVIMGRC